MVIISNVSQGGATTFSITTLSIRTFSITTLSIRTFSITTLSLRSFYVTLSISDAQHKNIQQNNIQLKELLCDT